MTTFQNLINNDKEAAEDYAANLVFVDDYINKLPGLVTNPAQLKAEGEHSHRLLAKAIVAYYRREEIPGCFSKNLLAHVARKVQARYKNEHSLAIA